MRSRKLLALVTVALAPLLTACPGAEPNYGIECVGESSGVIGAAVVSGDRPSGYVSTDGGLTWSRSDDDDPVRAPCDTGIISGYSPEGAPVFILEAGDQGIRFQEGEQIDVRRTGSEGWETSFDLRYLYSDARVSTLSRQIDGSRVRGARIRTGPFEAVHDPATGNVVAAMGHDGVLVRADGKWRLVGVGPYGGHDTSRVAVYSNGLPLLMMAGILFVLGPATVYGVVNSQIVSRGRGLAVERALMILLILAGCWVWWWFVAPLAMGLLYPSSGSAVSGLSHLIVLVPPIPILLAFMLTALLTGDETGVEQSRRVQFVIGSATALGSAIVFILWLEDTIPREMIAMPMAAIQATVLVVGFVYVKLRAPYVGRMGDPFEQDRRIQRREANPS